MPLTMATQNKSYCNSRWRHSCLICNRYITDKEMQIWISCWIPKWIYSVEGLALEISALESLYGGQFAFSFQLC